MALLFCSNVFCWPLTWHFFHSLRRRFEMKCFHFSNGSEKRGVEDEEASASSSRTSRVSWARSLSLMDSRRSEFDSDSRDFSDTLGFHEFLSQRRANHLHLFSFSDLKLATRGFNRSLLIGEGGFGSVYRGTVNHRSQIDVAVKQLNRNGHQARFPLFYFILKIE